MMVGQASETVAELSLVMVVFGWDYLGSKFSFVLTICEEWGSFFILSMCVNLIRLFLCDAALHKKVSEYDQEIPQSHTAAQPTAP